MKKTLKIIALIICSLMFSGIMALRITAPENPVSIEAGTSDKDVTAPAPEFTPEPTPVSTPKPTPVPEPEYFTLSFLGDCTLNSAKKFEQSDVGYARTMNGDYSYPFSNTAEYFAQDDFTFANLECNFSDDPSLQSIEWFYFKVPTEWANILIEGNVDFVGTANNHMMDFGQKGADSTYNTLEEYSIPYCKEGETQIFETESGLKIGIYNDYNNYFPETEKCVSAVDELKAQGAEYIICAFHWGKDELFYKPTEFMQDLAHACVDAGANMVYGSHTHCLQPVEEYNGGLILYSMGNWSFGGHTAPTDPDTAIVQVKVKRDVDGSISNDGWQAIPCCISSDIEGGNGHFHNKNSNNYYNNYCPTPYPEDNEGYERVMAKLNGSYDGPNGSTDYTWVATEGQK